MDLCLQLLLGQGQAAHCAGDMGDMLSAAVSNRSAVCFQMPLALKQKMSQPFQESKQGLCSYLFLPGIVTARADGTCLGLICMGYDTLGSTPRIDVSPQNYLQRHLRMGPIAV